MVQVPNVQRLFDCFGGQSAIHPQERERVVHSLCDGLPVVRRSRVTTQRVNIDISAMDTTTASQSHVVTIVCRDLLEESIVAFHVYLHSTANTMDTLDRTKCE